MASYQVIADFTLSEGKLLRVLEPSRMDRIVVVFLAKAAGVKLKADDIYSGKLYTTPFGTISVESDGLVLDANPFNAREGKALIGRLARFARIAAMPEYAERVKLVLSEKFEILNEIRGEKALLMLLVLRGSDGEVFGVAVRTDGLKALAIKGKSPDNEFVVGLYDCLRKAGLADGLSFAKRSSPA
ncbi:hypothetical protein [Desulfoglaeba alkanexedens]|uniref:Uncharacterized protein n=1 Tax=Desulfoglaeba alkanexedens ALDC TaxID=980445 RepID=A0A4P8L1D6_9BACT|nr:hypothetical protein [Desulfoglaeba alkanexedens]QCQ21484.1 hypothetical protein FDQ92_04405 [Desulfoglaeba alkanexedens ALDC]